MAEACTCGHDFYQHDPIDATVAGACGECDCEEFRNA
jgi:hypothetical protein